MARLLMPVLAALLVTACGAPAAPDAGFVAQASRTTEQQDAQTWGRACAVRVLAKLVELAATDYDFVTPGATCTNEFLGQDALVLPRTFRSSAIVAAPDRQTAQVTLVARTSRAYVTTIDVDGHLTFETR